MEQAYFDARTHRLVARADRRDADPVDARRHARAAGPARREPVLPARRAGTAGRRVTGTTHRETVADLMIDTVDALRAELHARGARAGRSLTPLDLERTFGLVGGDIFHGALDLDQMFSARPMLGHADYRGPVRGPVHVRLGRASGRRRHRRAGAQRGARGVAGFESAGERSSRHPEGALVATMRSRSFATFWISLRLRSQDDGDLLAIRRIRPRQRAHRFAGCARPKSGAARILADLHDAAADRARAREELEQRVAVAAADRARAASARSSLKRPSISSTASLLCRNTSRHIVGSDAAMRVKSRKPPAENFITSDCVTVSSSSAVPTML